RFHERIARDHSPFTTKIAAVDAHRKDWHIHLLQLATLGIHGWPHRRTILHGEKRFREDVELHAKRQSGTQIFRTQRSLDQRLIETRVAQYDPHGFVAK